MFIGFDTVYKNCCACEFTVFFIIIIHIVYNTVKNNLLETYKKQLVQTIVNETIPITCVCVCKRYFEEKQTMWEEVAEMGSCYCMCYIQCSRYFDFAGFFKIAHENWLLPFVVRRFILDKTIATTEKNR